MVRNYIRKHDLPDGESMEQAVNAVLERRLSIRNAAKTYGLKKSTVAYALKNRQGVTEEPRANPVTPPGRPSPSPNLKRKTVFSNKQEKEFVEYLLKCQLMNHGLTPKEARKLAFEWGKLIGVETPESWVRDDIAGVDWFSGFMKRNPELSIRKPENTSQARAAGFNPVVVNLFFDNLQKLYEKFKFPPNRIWNCDETGVPTVLPAPKVIARKGSKQVSQTVSAERGENVTMLGFISATGQALPPVFIFPRVKVNDRLFREGPTGCLGLSHPSGWMTSINFVAAIEHFIKLVKPSKEDPVLLLLDNHDSHVSVELVRLCKDNWVHLLTFPPHCSHRLQPLDVSVYGPFKFAMRESLNTWLQIHPGQRITIHETAQLCKEPFLRKFNPENITVGFTKAGIWPFNRSVFSEVDFLPAEVTNRPPPDDSLLDMEPIPSPSPPSPSRPQSELGKQTPEAVRPYPRADMTKPRRNARKQGRTRILTDTPEKDALEAEARARKEKQSKKPMPKQAKQPTAKKRKQIESPVESSGDDIELDDNSSDDSLHLHEADKDDVDKDIQAGDFVLVKFEYGKKKALVYYVGEVLDVVEKQFARVNFLRKQGDKFMFPQLPDIAEIDITDIELKLPVPSSAGGTGRAVQGLVFGCDLSMYALK